MSAMPALMPHAIETGAATRLALTPALLTVHNRRSDGAPVQLVLFKRSGAAPFPGQPLAWKVVRCTPAQPARLNYPFTQQLGAYDPQGAHLGLLDAVAGERFQITAEGVMRHATGDSEADAAGPNMVAVVNATAATRVDVLVYKDGRPLCRQPQLAPGATARFELLPYIEAAVVAGSGRAGEGLVEGGLVDALTVASAVRLSMLGLASADLVIESDLEGGGRRSSVRLAKLRFS